MSISEESVRDILKSVRFPGLPKDIVTLGLVETVVVKGDVVEMRLDIPSGNPDAVKKLAGEAHDVVATMDGVADVRIQIKTPRGLESMAAPTPEQSGSRSPGVPPLGQPVGASARPGPAIDRAPIAGVRHVVAVASGKGGVGKSTVASNLAASLVKVGIGVGLMDADIYGPSVPTMLGIHAEPEIADLNGKRAIIPVEKFGMKLMSLGFIQPEEDPVIWRGPLVMKAVRQFLRDVDWRGADVLVIDLPPGTGDAQLTLTQSAPLDGAVIVTTPQDVALIDARKGLAMFREVDVPVLGIVENMSLYHCPQCGHEEHIFKHGGGRVAADELGVPFLGAIPIDPAVARCGDDGTPIVVRYPESPAALAFHEVAKAVLQVVEVRGNDPATEVVS